MIKRLTVLLVISKAVFAQVTLGIHAGYENNHFKTEVLEHLTRRQVVFEETYRHLHTLKVGGDVEYIRKYFWAAMQGNYGRMWDGHLVVRDKIPFDGSMRSFHFDVDGHQFSALGKLGVPIRVFQRSKWMGDITPLLGWSLKYIIISRRNPRDQPRIFFDVFPLSRVCHQLSQIIPAAR